MNFNSHHLTLFLSLLIFSSSGLAQHRPVSNIEIVESTPVETDLDNPDIRDTYDVWREMISGAKSSLDIEQFYISDQKGEPLAGILSSIIAAGERGVQIRLIVDSRMYKTYPETVDLLAKSKNISVRIIDFGKFSHGIQHAKYFIVDRATVFLGSQNFDWRALKHIHEIGIRIVHPGLAMIYEDIFNLDWQIADRNDPALLMNYLHKKKYQVPLTLVTFGNDTVKLIPTMSPIGIIPDSTLWDETNIVRMIDEAKNEVYCQFLTYSPVSRDKNFYAVLDNALRRAAVRGVTVKMIISDWSLEHQTTDHLKSLSLLPNLEIKFSSIPEWSGGYVPFARVEHCKFLTIDSTESWIGTSNWEKSYFYTCRNLGIVVKDRSITQQLRRIFNRSWDGPYTTLIKSEVEYSPRIHGE